MVRFPNCKINLGLRILHKRPDGYHNLETIFYPIPLKDALEIVPSTDGNTTCFLSGIPVAGDPNDNLCIKAWKLLYERFPSIQPIHFYLYKAIPTGAGLGGGSADGAFALLMLNDYFQLNLTEADLLELALSLGSDCPFFILNKPALATGRGEILTQTDLDLSGYYLTLINPGIHVPTGWAFSQITPNNQHIDSLEKLIKVPISEWKECIINDFQLPIANTHPEIQNCINTLYQAGAAFAAMSGSGSSVFGIFKQPHASLKSTPAHYFVKANLKLT
ncbi:MAG: 4-(cytidine 5'-diphospho)-2-C-methyl-D-erythritol kinase [Chitinophagaceae bacterium]|uniref:4-(cytidine 5'-diphospho)-2-C-methyl-D-erythritol kinase n=1 Tax=unclassified Paraflavitalea TaxID=2798305 RepID=UPI003D3572E6|nr:4-(cytidine 5'-diphospho)-2-C-methyl-D-erythritol kinase [Chitinophagaceae bacterium]